MGSDRNGIWAIIDTVGGQYIGEVVACQDANKDDMDESTVLESEVITLSPSYKIEVQYVPMPMPGGQVGFTKQVLVSNFSILGHGAPLHITGPRNICFFSEMSAADRKAQFEKIANIEDENKRQAARASGLVLPGKG